MFSPRHARRFFALLLIAALPSASGCYYLQAAAGQLEISTKSRPIDALIEDAATDPALRARLEYVRAAREFAASELKLPDNETYRSYADLERPFVVWNVFATDRYAIEPRTWCFPVAGCVVYRGYFDRSAAEGYARSIRLAGGDAMVAGAVAYSTLGHFDDPVLNTMLRWDDADLAATLFHELAHQVVYVPGDARFNEAFATVVETAGLERWLASRGRESELEAWRVRRSRAEDFMDLLLTTRARLSTLYASGRNETELEGEKQQAFGQLKYEYALLRERWGGYGGYDAWFDRALNNAHLVPVATYHACVPGFERVLAEAGGDFERFYAEVRRLADISAEARADLLCRSGPDAISASSGDSPARSP